MKAILVVDMPNSCGDCPFRKKVSPDDIECLANGEVFEETFNLLMYVRKNKCPLKPMPQRIEEGYPNDDYTIGKADGWNKCLEELEK